MASFICIFKPLKTKCNISHIRIQCVSHSKLFTSVIKKINLLMMYKVKVAVCSEILTKHIRKCEHHVEFLNVKPGGT